MTTQSIGYGRISTRDRHPESQHDALNSNGVDAVFVEAMSGTRASRPQWDLCRSHLRRGDTLVCTRLDRLGRSTQDLLNIAAWLREHEVNLVVIEQDGIDTRTTTGKVFFTVLSAVAEFEHDLIVDRTMDGLAAARARGRKGGRKPVLSPTQVKNIKKRYDAKDGTVAELAADYGVTRQSIYRALERA